jgi:hypothetical protein
MARRSSRDHGRGGFSVGRKHLSQVLMESVTKDGLISKMAIRDINKGASRGYFMVEIERRSVVVSSVRYTRHCPVRPSV